MYIVLASNSGRKVVAFGNRDHQPFNNEKEVERAAARLAKKFPSADLLVLPVESAE